jgi:hypothetical protein
MAVIWNSPRRHRRNAGKVKSAIQASHEERSILAFNISRASPFLARALREKVPWPPVPGHLCLVILTQAGNFFPISKAVVDGNSCHPGCPVRLTSIAPSFPFLFTGAGQNTVYHYGVPFSCIAPSIFLLSFPAPQLGVSVITLPLQHKNSPQQGALGVAKGWVRPCFFNFPSIFGPITALRRPHRGFPSQNILPPATVAP